MQQVANGLLHMHAQGIGHGDVKPENFLLFDDGEGWYVAKISDFGMARGETPEGGNGGGTRVCLWALLKVDAPELCASC